MATETEFMVATRAFFPGLAPKVAGLSDPDPQSTCIGVAKDGPCSPTMSGPFKDGKCC